MSRINTNVTSMLATRVLNAQNKGLNTSLERLSTGLRINRGSDDPAGLIASEVLRGEIGAIKAAIQNGERASNVIATAEGALNEVSSLLVELEDMVATAANSGGMSGDEIDAKQLQVDSILSTINRIANSTEFGGVKLVNGALDYNLSTYATSAIADVNIYSAKLFEGQEKSVTIEVTGSAETGQLTFTGAGTGADAVTIEVAGKDGTEIFSFAASTAVADMKTAINQVSDVTGVSATTSGTGALFFNSTEYGSEAFVSVEAIDGTFTVTGGTGGTDYGEDADVIIAGQAATTDGLTAKLNTDSLSMEVRLTAGFGQTTTTKEINITGGGATFSMAPDVYSGRASIGIQSLATSNLGSVSYGYLNSISSGQTNGLSSGNLGTAQRIIKAAASQVSSQRGRLGAFQRLTIDSMVNSLNVTLENTSAAESAIRDTDYATETSNMTRAQILVQAATTVLRQANAAPQNVLALLS